MKNILIIGVGGTGSRAVDTFFQKVKELGNQSGNNVEALVFDTDAGDIQTITSATPIVMADPASVGTICDRVGKEYIREWFPCDDKTVRAQEMVRGAAQWRKKSFLAFVNLMNKPQNRAAFLGALEKMTIDPSASCEIYIVASLAGGTGSGSFVPIALYAKRYLRKNLGKDPIVNAMLAMPDIYAEKQTPDNRVKIFANAYAILRELNAINLVARNHNEGTRTAHKKAPIKLKLGNKNEPNVGLLFDASDRSFWTPEAAPFSQVFLLDKIPGVGTPEAHDIVLANSLYTLLCTQIGAAFDSEYSNHDALRSQNNGSNAIYASVSTSQIRFPADTVLDYLAYKKAVDSCEKEWLVLHKMVEQKLREKEKEAKSLNRHFTLQDGEYAKMYIDAIHNLEESSREANVLDIVNRGTAVIDKKGAKNETAIVDAYIKKLLDYIKGLMPAVPEKQAEPGKKEKPTRDNVVKTAQDCRDNIESYFAECVEKIRACKNAVPDSIINFDEDKENSELYSIIDNLLMRNGKYVHPVAAVVQLCYLKNKLTKYVKPDSSGKVWKEINQRGTIVLNDELLKFESASDGEQQENDDENKPSDNLNSDKSAYFNLGETDRFYTIITDSKQYSESKKRTNTRFDKTYVIRDADTIMCMINRKSMLQLRNIVLSVVSQRVDMLIDKYRMFFTRFDKEKAYLLEKTKMVKGRNCGIVDSVINVYSDKDSKDAILKKVFEESGPESDNDVIEADNVAGKGVYDSVFKAAVATIKRDSDWNDKDVSSYTSLFDSIVGSYRSYIKKSDAFALVAAYNPIEAVEESLNGDGFEAAIRNVFSVAQELATPGLRLDESTELGDLIVPSDIMVFMMSANTGKYIKMNAEKFGISVSSDNASEARIISACAGEFISKYSGCEHARVVLASNMPDQVIYCTGETMDITPLRIPKINELSDDPMYFNEYRKALNNAKRYDSDMWNPHLGFNFHSRGYLPFMNDKMEKQCDDKMVKALFYAFAHKNIVFKKGSGTFLSKTSSFYWTNNGNMIPMKSPDGVIIGKKNIAQMFAWLRNLDESVIDEWSKLFDVEISKEKDALPSIAGESDIKKLETSLTIQPFFKLLFNCLYEDEDIASINKDASAMANEVANEGTETDSKNDKATNKIGPTILEFAYMIKTSEESSRDCDDAERILAVAYDVFYDMVAHRVNPQTKQEEFIQVYKHEVENMFVAFATAYMIPNDENRERVFSQNVEWINGAGAFLDIDVDIPLDEFGNININSNFDYKSSKVKTYFNKFKN